MSDAAKSTTPPPALLLRGVVVRRDGRVTLDVPALTVEAGETLTLVGPNGAGKSTLLLVAALLRRPDAGDVRIAGSLATRRTERALRRRVALVWQDPLLFSTGVLANAASGLRFRGVGRREAERRAMAWLERFGVGALGERPARGLSGGEARRVALARAFAVEPDLLLLDEPFAALDAPSRAELGPELAAHLRVTGTAAVLVGHDPAEALALGDRLGVVLAGRLAQIGPPAGVLARPASAAVARLLGIANVLPGRVVGTEGPLLVVDLGGSTVRVRPPEPAAGWEAGVTLAVGAARVAASAPERPIPAGWNALAGVVANRALTPDGVRLTVALPGGVRLVAALADSPTGSLTVGAPVVAAFPPEAAHPIRNDAPRPAGDGGTQAIPRR
ncbi:MAG: hypothetical protein AVDCRST_MAG73-4174 [uncultured Thermomicrobiales bacterium]|uniref:ABC transporter domain-containing protein n=1 Tax=uncultured Thermomicrobiales bacterium TaxID=1645740 RepID=A0A6J4V4U6_9BACT|nr:MAG: hypothetical protein AVDCRST_MAG73-4174 [uncultured Thermomicrobiales bacterium]